MRNEKMSEEDKEKHKAFLEYFIAQINIIEAKALHIEDQYRLLDEEAKKIVNSKNILKKELEDHKKWIMSFNKTSPWVDKIINRLCQIWR